MAESTEEGLSFSSENITSKESIRQKVWDYIQRNQLANFPTWTHGRIPNFKGCEKAAARLGELKEFHAARNIKVNPDKPQEPVRLLVLEKNKNLFVAVPKLANALLKRIEVPKNATNNDFKKYVVRKGIDECGQQINLDDKIKIDFIIFGSVAVSVEGYRIGKGKGYGDLEYAMLHKMKAIDSNTLIATTVHDCQVFDTLPVDIFGAHDVPIDIIVTPTRVIYVNHHLPKPQKMFWDQITESRIELIPILNALRQKEELEGKNVTLKVTPSNTDSRSTTSSSRSRHSSNLDASIDMEETDNRKYRPRRGRLIRRKNINKYSHQTFEETGPSNLDQQSSGRSKVKKVHPEILFSLQIDHIDKSVRIQDLKTVLAERKVKPCLINWHGLRGYCFLHFSKPDPTTVSVSEMQSFTADKILAQLQDLPLNPDSKQPVTVELITSTPLKSSLSN